MTRIEQPEGTRGSLKWIQRVIAGKPELIDVPIMQRLPGSPPVSWLSPLREDQFAEYRDAAFLKRLGIEDLKEDLAAFWPARGPQWDALGRSANGDLLLVEAKAHIPEILSSPTQAGARSRARIELALEQTVKALRAKPIAPWTDAFYQYANRLAHLDFLRRVHGKRAWLIFVYFVGDEDMKGPASKDEWEAALQVTRYVMGLERNHPLSRYIIDVFADVRDLA